MLLHECPQDSFISAINFLHLPTEEAHVHSQRDEAVIAAAGGARECSDLIFSRSLPTPLVFLTERHNLQPLQSWGLLSSDSWIQSLNERAETSSLHPQNRLMSSTRKASDNPLDCGVTGLDPQLATCCLFTVCSSSSPGQLYLRMHFPHLKCK